MIIDKQGLSKGHQLAGTPCAQCGDALVAPASSQYLKEIGVRHLWVCERCGQSVLTFVSVARPIEGEQAAQGEQEPNVCRALSAMDICLARSGASGV
jgi:hypothetical protein